LPIVLTPENIKADYLNERTEVIYKNIHSIPKIGIMNGLWANSLGMGGIIPIECSFFPSSIFLDLKLTGMQGDVMKESMNVAKTLAWKLLTKKKQKELLKFFKDTKSQGIHIHCPEGATPKDGPSAGSTITSAIYSLFTGKKINNDFAMTGEITLQGDVTAIGGLDLKIIGGIRAGVKTFIYPESNQKDLNKFKEKQTDVFLQNITFKPVKHISDILKIIFI
jgi:ATP-dependent Lon protease